MSCYPGYKYVVARMLNPFVSHHYWGKKYVKHKRGKSLLTQQRSSNGYEKNTQADNILLITINMTERVGHLEGIGTISTVYPHTVWMMKVKEGEKRSQRGYYNFFKIAVSLIPVGVKFLDQLLNGTSQTSC